MILLRAALMRWPSYGNMLRFPGCNFPSDTGSQVGAGTSTTPVFARSHAREGMEVLWFLNIIAYIINAVFTFGGGTLGWFGEDITSVSNEYQTLITPAG